MYPVDFEIPIQYSTQEYRSFVRNLFQMKLVEVKKQNTHIQEENEESWDDETMDEMLYDSGSAKRFLNFIEKETIENRLFRKLYEKAATQMFSQDLGIGIAVLFSYDYLHYYHGCLRNYFNNNKQLTEKDPFYKTLLSLL